MRYATLLSLLSASLLATTSLAAGGERSVILGIEKDGLKYEGPCSATFLKPGVTEEDGVVLTAPDADKPMQVAAGVYDVIVACPSSEGTLRAVVKIDARKKNIDKLVRMNPGFALVFVERDGKPVGADIQIIGARGRVVATGRDKVAIPVPPGKLSVIATVDKKESGSTRPVLGSVDIKVRKGKKTETSIDTSDGVFVLSLTNNGKPAEGAGALRPQGSPMRLIELSSDEDTPAPPGTYDIVTTLSASHDFAEVVKKRVRIRPGKTTKARVAHTTGTLAPKLWLGGAPIATDQAGKVELFLGAAPAAFNTITATDEAIVKPGTYRVVATLEGKKLDDGGAYTAEADVKVRARKTATVKLDLTPAALDITAQLGGKDAALRVDVFKKGGETPVASKKSGKDGKALFTLSPGNYRVQVVKKATQGELVAPTNVYLSVGSRQKRTIDINVGIVTVQVFDQGVAVPAEVLFFAADAGGSAPVLGVPAGVDAYLPPGAYALSVRRKGVMQQFAPIKVATGRSTERQVELSAKVQADTREGPSGDADK